MQFDEKFIQAFSSKITSPTPQGCWKFGKSNTTTIYKHFKYLKISYSVHRTMWEITNETKIPEKLLIRHKCDTPSCCNPSHLELGNTVQNSMDAVIRRRNKQVVKTHCIKGHEYTEDNIWRTKANHRFCKICYKAHSLKYNQENKEKIYLQRKSYRLKNVEETRIKKKKYWEQNKKSINLKRRKCGEETNSSI